MALMTRTDSVRFDTWCCTVADVCRNRQFRRVPPTLSRLTHTAAGRADMFAIVKESISAPCITRGVSK